MGGMAKTAATIRFTAQIMRPRNSDSWAFLRLPPEASKQLPSRSMVSVEGTFNGRRFQTTLLPDGEGGHWLKADSTLLESTEAKIGEEAIVEIAPVTVEPEPEVPADFESALDAAPPKARDTWTSITPVARRDWIFWIVSGKKAETRTKRIEVAISKLSAGSRRPCCFDRSGMYDKSLSCPVPADE
jgi:hypothetical protein